MKPKHPQKPGRRYLAPGVRVAFARVDVARVCARLRAAPADNLARVYADALPILGDLATCRLFGPDEAAAVVEALGVSTLAQLRALNRAAKRQALAA